MLKIKRMITALLCCITLLLFLPAVPAYASDIRGTEKIWQNSLYTAATLPPVYSECLQNRYLKDRYLVSDKYVMDTETGEIYYYPDYNEAFAGGMADDGYYYDDVGKQVSSYTYIKEKYGEWTGSREIIFDSFSDMDMYIRYLQNDAADRQCIYFEYYNTDTGKYRIPASEFNKIIQYPSAEYQNYIQNIVSRISPLLSTKNKIHWASSIIAESLSYDWDYLTLTLDDAIRDGRGVCYHYSRILHDVLSALGIKSEMMSGTSKVISSDTHSWIRAWDDKNGCWIYEDPCLRSTTRNEPLSLTKYFSNYRQIKTDGSYIPKTNF